MSPIEQYTTQSGWMAITASRSSIATMPVSASSPARVPASLPIFSDDETHTPVNSNCGLVISAINASRPTFPVPTWATGTLGVAVAERSVQRRQTDADHPQRGLEHLEPAIENA